jgi:hypothetical protein
MIRVVASHFYLLSSCARLYVAYVLFRTIYLFALPCISWLKLIEVVRFVSILRVVASIVATVLYARIEAEKLSSMGSRCADTAAALKWTESGNKKTRNDCKIFKKIANKFVQLWNLRFHFFSRIITRNLILNTHSLSPPHHNVQKWPLPQIAQPVIWSCRLSNL